MKAKVGDSVRVLVGGKPTASTGVVTRVVVNPNTIHEFTKYEVELALGERHIYPSINLAHDEDA